MNFESEKGGNDVSEFNKKALKATLKLLAEMETSGKSVKETSSQTPETFFDKIYLKYPELCYLFLVDLDPELSPWRMCELKQEKALNLSNWIMSEYSNLLDLSGNEGIDRRKICRQYFKCQKSEEDYIQTPKIEPELYYLIYSANFIGTQSAFSSDSFKESLRKVDLSKDLILSKKNELNKALRWCLSLKEEMNKTSARQRSDGLIFSIAFLNAMLRVNIDDWRYTMVLLFWFKKLLYTYFSLPYEYPVSKDILKHMNFLKKSALASDEILSNDFLQGVLTYLTNALKPKLPPAFRKYPRMTTEQMNAKSEEWGSTEVNSILTGLCQKYNPDDKSSIQWLVKQAFLGFEASRLTTEKNSMTSLLKNYANTCDKEKIGRIDLPFFLLLLYEGMNAFSSFHEETHLLRRLGTANLMNSKKTKK